MSNRPRKNVAALLGRPRKNVAALLGTAAITLFADQAAWSQMIDRTKAPNDAHEGIAKSLQEQIGAGRGTDTTPGSCCT